MRASLYLIGMAAAFAGAEASAEQAAPTGARLHLTTRVEPFCAIAWDEKPVEIDRRGSARIGTVTDTCNTHGYVVTAQFAHLRGGVLVVEGERIPIGDDGAARVVARSAKFRNAAWRLEEAVFAPGYASSLMWLSIAPL